MADASQPEAVADVTGPASRSSPGLGPGAKVGRYLILERIGAGGMGVVFSAYDPELDRRVAIKVLASDLMGEESRLRLLREAQAMARLSHPNVVPVYDAGTFEGRVFVAMEFVQGVTLRGWLDGETRGWTEVLETMRRAALGLQAAHEANLVHRDFKPDNVMVGDDGRVRVLDFGLARSTNLASEPEPFDRADRADDATADDRNGEKALAAQVTSQGAMLGTPAYMPPEQLEGREVDARTDQWSFCVTLYEALYGSRPFEGATVAAFVLAMHNDGLQPPPQSSAVPPSIFAAIARGLELEPNARHPSMGALLRALELAPPPRSRAVPAGVIAFGTLIAGTWWWSGERADGACDSRMLAASAVWSPDAQKAGADAFERSAVRYGSEAWARASARVTDYVTDWSREAGKACRSAGPGTAEVDTLRSRCLDTRLRRLTSVVDAFANANDDVVQGAIATAFRLPELESCADASALLAAVRPPEDPAKLAELARLEVSLEEAASHKFSGDYVEGSRLAQAVVDEARVLAYDPFTGEALRTLASFATRSGDNETARDLYLEAFEVAATARDDAGAAQAAADLLYVLGSQLRAPEAAEAWTTVGATMIKRAGLSERAPEATLHNAVGNVAFSQADYDRALTEFSTARDIWESVPGDYPIDLGFVFSNIGAVQATLGRYGEARDQHLRALQIRQETFGPEHPDVAMSLGNLGIVAFRVGDMAAARDYQERALAIKRATLPPGHPSLGATAMNLGLVLSRMGELDEAIETFEESVEIRTASLGPEHPDVAAAVSSLADAYSRKGGRDEEAEELHRRALAIQKKTLGPDHPAVAGSLQNLSAALLKMGRPEEAAPLVEQALAIFTEALGPDHEAVAMCRLTLSHAYEASGRPEAALEAAERAVATAERGGREGVDVALAQVHLGQLRWRTGKDRAAARTLVEAAAAKMAETPDREPEAQAEVEAWLQANPMPG